MTNEVSLTDAIADILKNYGIPTKSAGNQIIIDVGLTSVVTITHTDNLLHINYTDKSHVRKAECLSFDIFKPGTDPVEEAIKHLAAHHYVSSNILSHWQTERNE